MKINEKKPSFSGMPYFALIISSINSAVLIVLLTYVLNHGTTPLFRNLLVFYGFLFLIYAIIFFIAGCLLSFCFLFFFRGKYRSILNALYSVISLCLLLSVFSYNIHWYRISISPARISLLSLIMVSLFLWMLFFLSVFLVLFFRKSHMAVFIRFFHFYAMIPLIVILLYPIDNMVGAPNFSSPQRTGIVLDESQKMLILGIDGFDPRLAKYFVLHGELPVLEELFQTSSYGPLKTHIPTSSPVIWTTIATGMGPLRHGIRDFVLYENRTGESGISLETIPRRVFFGRLLPLLQLSPKPISSLQRKEKTFWEILNEYQISTGIINWWATIPVFPVNGFIVSNFLFGHELYDWDAISTKAEMYYYPNDPEMTAIIGETGNRLPEIQKPFISQVFTGEATTIFGQTETGTPPKSSAYRQGVLKQLAIPGDSYYWELSQSLFRERDCDLLALYLNGLDITEHLFWPDEPLISPLQKSLLQTISPEILHYYQWMDTIIGQLQNQYPQRRLLILSDHGMNRISGATALYYRWIKKMPFLKGFHDDAPDGFFLFHGQGIQEGYECPDASVFDIAPTLLYLCNVPLSDKMSGKPIVSIMTPEQKSNHGPITWAPYAALDSKNIDEYSPTKFVDMLEHLKKLGYIE